MKKLIIFLFMINLFAFNNQKIENLMGKDNYQTYNKLLDRIFIKKNYNIYSTLKILKDNGLLNLFFKKAKIIDTKFIFLDDNNLLDIKTLNDTLLNLGYYYFYPVEIDKDNNFMIDIEFKSEHFIDPVSLIDTMRNKGCEIVDVNKTNNNFVYKFNCENAKLSKTIILTDKEEKYINAKGDYWIENDDFSKISIKTKKIDFWHPLILMYDKDLNLINIYKKNQKTTNLILNIDGAKYIKITDIYTPENFKRGIYIKGLK